MKVYTKTGDDGTTCIIGGGRLEKCLPLMEVIGDLDELNGWLGLLDLPEQQANVMVVSAVIAGSTKVSLNQDEIQKLEQAMDNITSQVPQLSSFIIPTGKDQSEFFIARAVCRRAERHFVALDNKDDFPNVLEYLNRLSDFLFMLGYKSNINARHWP